jgi:hypothetical protein
MKCRCKVFISIEKDGDTCECGRKKRDHNEDALKISNIKQWNSAVCTTDDGITNAFGDIFFVQNSDLISKVNQTHLK